MPLINNLAVNQTWITHLLYIHWMLFINCCRFQSFCFTFYRKYITRLMFQEYILETGAILY